MVDLRQYRELPAIQLLRSIVREWWGLELSFCDPNGWVLDHADGRIVPPQNSFCRAALFSKEGFRRCNESVAEMRERAPLRPDSDAAGARYREAQVHRCHLGFDIVSSPIRVADRVVGYLFTSGSVHEPLADEQRAELSRMVEEFAPDDAVALQESPELPELSGKELSHLRDLIAFGAREVAAHCERQRRLGLLGGPDPDTEGPPRYDIVGRSPAVRALFDLLDKVVRSQSTVLVHGESGTGKELIARAIHFNGPRKRGPFVVQNCSALNDNLLESALFGHMRGAFTGAVKDTKGLFESADGGTFFLDEIGDMSPSLQVKLLRVLQEGTFTPVGATRAVSVDVRVVAASHKDLAAMVSRGEFREDLYYRINVLKITVPPLRDRIEDLPLLVGHFLRRHAGEGGEPQRLSDEALAAMSEYRWPGNIRELENEIERMTVLGAGQPELGLDLVSHRIRDAQPRPARETRAGGSLREAVEAVEADVISKGLIRTHWNKSQLARELGISRSNLIQKCAYYGLEKS